MPLNIIATPIGNLSDISLRAIETLKNCELIYCEDTRVSIKLLNHFNIQGKKLISCNKENEHKRISEIIKALDENINIALISDAGTPLISDPGSELLSKLWEHKKNLKIQSIPSPEIIPIGGISSLTTALSVCPIDCSRFCFEGFLPHGGKQRRRVLRKLLEEERALVFFESPHRIIDTLEDLRSIFLTEEDTKDLKIKSGKRSNEKKNEKSKNINKDNQIFFAREMTKIHEEYYFGTIEEAIEYLQDKFPNKKIQGEFVLIF
ncbi:MAG: 16S rRNA (cytidine(1402)-2'-O)-methyltransferase [Candidatus Caenarcaniphilales bacterium]|nr:16S rRNA (cytidine(1402)-2'-O)-methyltransferase [Candidatus Caenarcaniphilales bacterium]